MMLAKHPTWPARQRGGYTLVEMLVAAGVSLMIMVILTGAFQAGMDTFRKLRAQGNMQERLRMARTALCDDLSSPHFENAAGDSGWDKQDYVSFQDMRPLVDGGSWSPPSDGFFRIWQANEAAGSYTGWQPNDTPLPFIPEGADSSGMFFTRARTHAFHFTVRRRGGGPENMYRTSDFMTSPATAPWRQVNPPQAGLVWPTNFINPVDYRGQPDPVGSTNPFVTQWAEVAWFLVPNGSSAGSSTPLFNLYRRQLLLAPPPSPMSSSLPSPPYPANMVSSPPYVFAGPPPAPITLPAVCNGASNMNVVAGENYATLNGQTSFNPEISRKRQFLNNAAANYQVIYNRTADVTQPRFRYGMLPAVDPQRVGNQEIARAQLAGVPDESPAPFGSQPYLQTFPTQPYLPLTLDLNHVNGITNADHQKYDNNDLVLSDVISFEVKVLWDTPISRKDPRLTQPHNFGTFGLGPNLAYSFTYQGQNYQVANSDYPYDYLPMSPLIPPQQQQPPQQPLPGYTGNLVFAGTAPQGLQPPAPGFSARVFDTWSQDAAAYGFQEQLAGVPPKSTPNWKRTDYPQDQLTVNATGTRVPLPIRVKSVLIRIRIWDQKAEQVRQITIIQDV